MKFPTPDELVRGYSPYQPTHALQHMGPFFEDLLKLPEAANVSAMLFDFKGKCWRNDALKLYEMAHFAQGDILELGCFFGASTIVMAKATDRSITTIDLSPDAIKVARANFLRHHVDGNIITVCDDGANGIRELKGRQFHFAFVDHDHTYEAVHSACLELPSVMAPGAYVFFHDFQDERNFVDDPRHKMGVYAAVRETLADKWHFAGYSGYGALFRVQP